CHAVATATTRASPTSWWICAGTARPWKYWCFTANSMAMARCGCGRMRCSWKPSSSTVRRCRALHRSRVRADPGRVDTVHGAVDAAYPDMDWPDRRLLAVHRLGDAGLVAPGLPPAVAIHQ